MAVSLPSRRQAGFTILEMLVVLVLLLVGLMIAADLLMEASRLFAETSGEALDTPVPLAAARIRADIQGSTAVVPELSPLDGKLDKVHILGGGAEVVYQKLGDTIVRSLYNPEGPPQAPEVLWRKVTGWSCEEGGMDAPALLSVTYAQRTTPRTPLPVMPADRGPLAEEVTETLYVLPRGNGW
jgi:prepilin-type N-terminal cleavage/methylation domain-containing protein